MSAARVAQVWEKWVDMRVIKCQTCSEVTRAETRCQCCGMTYISATVMGLRDDKRITKST